MIYSIDVRKKVLEYENTHTIQETAKTFNISTWTVSTWKKRLREKGCLNPTVIKRKPRKLDHAKLIEYVETNPDKYLREIAEVFNVSTAAIGKALKKLGFTLKKRPNYTRNGMRRGERIIKKKKYLNIEKKI